MRRTVWEWAGAPRAWHMHPACVTRYAAYWNFPRTKRRSCKTLNLPKPGQGYGLINVTMMKLLLQMKLELSV